MTTLQCKLNSPDSQVIHYSSKGTDWEEISSWKLEQRHVGKLSCVGSLNLNSDDESSLPVEAASLSISDINPEALAVQDNADYPQGCHLHCSLLLD